jgi:2-polyprenyl-3-methyl-5-hydroxy-6-metoxy-1,4-benzoquinol methylase
MSSFDAKAKEWDKLPRRVQNALEIAAVIKQKVHLTKEMEIVDFGVGTGLLGFEIAHYVKKVYGVDTSKKMLEEIEEKNTQKLHIEPVLADLTKEELNLHVDGIISSMTLHHIEDVYYLFEKFYEMLKPNGFIAIADLEKEDGTFHSDNSGVFHFGFEAKELLDITEQIGYKHCEVIRVHTIEKPKKNYPVFLLIARR